MGIDPTQTIVDLVTTTGELDPDKLGGYVVHHASGMDVLAAPLRPEDAELVTEDRIGQLIDVAKAAYDIVVLDTPPHFDATTLAALDRSDRLVLLDDHGHPHRQERQARAADAQPPAVPARAHRARRQPAAAARRPARERHLAHARHADHGRDPGRQGDRRRRQPRRPGHRRRPRARLPRRPSGSSPSSCCRSALGRRGQGRGRRRQVAKASSAPQKQPSAGRQSIFKAGMSRFSKSKDKKAA